MKKSQSNKYQATNFNKPGTSISEIRLNDTLDKTSFSKHPICCDSNPDNVIVKCSEKHF